jgi:hypothetical protein
MKGKAQANFTEMLDQAIETFDTALKTGVKMQEEATKWWTEMLGETSSIQDIQDRMRTMMMDALPSTQRNIDQYMRVIDKTYHSSMDLLKKAFETAQCESIVDAQMKTQELWEATLTALRTNAQALVQINAQAMESWAQFAHKDMAEQATEAMSEAARGAAHAAQSATAHAPRSASAKRATRSR